MPVIVCLALSVPAKAQITIAWNSASGGSWTNASNWATSIVPNNNTDIASITLGGTYTVTLASTGYTLDGLVLNSANATLQLTSSTLSISPLVVGPLAVTAGTLSLNSSNIYTPASLGVYAFTNAGTITSSVGTSFIYGSGGLGNGLGFTNTGNVTVTGGTLYLGNGVGDSVTNSVGGVITANSGTLNLNGGVTSLSNLGTLQAINSGIINLGGNLTTANLGGTIGATTGGVINITGNLDNSAGTLNAPTGGGIFTLNGGKITGGTVNGGALAFGPNNGSILDGATMSGGFSAASGDNFRVQNGTSFTGGTTTFANNYVYLQGSGNALTLASGETWSGNLTIYALVGSVGMTNNGTITEGSGSTNNIYGGGIPGFTFSNNGTVSSTSGTLIIGNGATDAVTNGVGGTIFANGGNVVLGNSGTDTITNSGTLKASGSGILTLGVGSTTWSNSGTLLATAGGTINLGGTFPTSNLTSTIDGAGGTLDITGTLNNNSAVLGTPTTGNYTLNGGTITGGAVTGGANGLTFGTAGNSILDNVVMNGNFSVPLSGTFRVQNGVSFNAGTTTFANSYVYLQGSGNSLTLSPSETWIGNMTLYGIVGSVGVTNQGTITENSGSTNNIYGGGNAGFTFSNTGTVSSTSGTLIVGNGGTDAVTNGVGGTIFANGGNVILGNSGTDTVANNGILKATGAGTLTLGGSTTTTWTNPVGGLIQATAGGTVDLGGTFASANLTSGTIDGTTGTINITGNLNNTTLNAPNGGGIFTLNGGMITGGTVNSGALTFGTAGGSILNNVVMNGTFAVPSSGSFRVENVTSFTGGTTTFANSYVYLQGTPGTALTLASGETWTGNMTIYGLASGMGVLNNGTITNTSGANNIYGGSYTGFSFTNTGTVSAPAGSLGIGIGATDAIVNSVGGTISANGGNITIGDGAGDSFVNNGTIQASGAGVLSVGYGNSTWTNTGTINATAGGTVDFYGNFTTANLAGTINGLGGTLNLMGTVDNTSAVLAAPTSGLYTLAGGTILHGSVNGFALTFGGSGGTLSGVTMNGGFQLPSGVYSSFTANTNTTFTGGTTNFTTSGYDTIYLNGTGTALSLAPSATWSGAFNIYSQASGITLANAGALNFTNGTSSVYGNNGGFTFVNTGSVLVTSGSLYLGYYANDVISNAASGTITANNGTVHLGYNLGTWNNLGTILATNNGTVDFEGNFTTANLNGTIGSNTGGLIKLVGNLNNASATLNAPSSGTFTLAGGTISGGTVTGGALTFSNSGTLSGVTMSGNFALPTSAYDAFYANANTTFTGGTSTFAAGGYYDTIYLNGTGTALTIAPSASWSGTFNISGQAPNALTAVNQGTLNFLGAASIYGNGYGLTFLNSGTLTSNGGSLLLGYYTNDAITNTGTITANGGTVDLGYNQGTWSNSGTLHATNNGVISFGGNFVTANLGGTILADTGGLLNLQGMLNNAAATLNAPNTGVFTLAGGTITGGTVASGALTFSNSSGTLDGVTMTGNFSLPASAYASFTAKNNTTFTGGTTTFASGGYYDSVFLGSAGTALTLAPSATWNGTFSIYGQATNVALLNQGTIDITAGGNVFYGNGYGLSVLNGGLLASMGSSLFIGSYANDGFTNQPGGTLSAGGGIIYLGYGSSTVSNLASGTLTGGTWVAAAGGTLSFEGTSPVSTIASGTTVDLDGVGSTLRTKSGTGPSYQMIETTLTANSGTLEVLTNRNFASTTAGVTNAGTIQLGGGTFSAASLTNTSGSALTGFGTFAPAGGVTIGGGALVSPGSAGANSSVGALAFNSLTWGQGGNGRFDIETAAGAAGTGYDTISTPGAFTITATPGNRFTIFVESVNPGTGLPGLANFNLAQTYQWTLVSAGSLSGFSASDFSIDTSSFANGPGNFSVTANSTSLFLNFTPVPEPSTWALVAVGASVVGVACRRRRTSRASGVS